MIRSILLLIGSLLEVTTIPAAEVLIVADEFPAMHFLAEKLKSEDNLSALVVAQDNLPAELKPFRAVVVYIHGELKAPTEESLIRYTRAGGRLVLLHHSISSGKRKNRDWFPFLGIDLPTGDVTAGGYRWIEPATLDLVNLAPDHFITTHRVNYPGRVAFRLPDEANPPADRPAFTLTESEVYLNHTFTRPRTVLLGFRFVDRQNAGTVYQQNTAGWIMAAGQGQVVYLKAGHSQSDFEQPTYLRIVLNAVIFTPTAVSTASP
ncbi:MAG: ThuA domain-containing protein [Verrucomicrobia bacterium]|nr:ThuA domain-containing protein [Verrucomicrobiota bacterium]